MILRSTGFAKQYRNTANYVVKLRRVKVHVALEKVTDSLKQLEDLEGQPGCAEIPCLFAENDKSFYSLWRTWLYLYYITNKKFIFNKITIFNFFLNIEFQSKTLLQEI